MSPCAAATAPDYSDGNAGISAALALNGGPVVMADRADNARGGAPSDNTTSLLRMLARNMENATLGPIWDPITVRLCFDPGPGARFPLRFGGKIGPTSGQPVDATVTVVGAAIKVCDVEVVLISNRT